MNRESHVREAMDSAGSWHQLDGKVMFFSQQVVDGYAKKVVGMSFSRENTQRSTLGPSQPCSLWPYLDETG